jgi:hypothetical protein
VKQSEIEAYMEQKRRDREDIEVAKGERIFDVIKAALVAESQHYEWERPPHYREAMIKLREVFEEVVREVLVDDRVMTRVDWD